MKSVAFRMFVLVFATIVLLACGKAPSESERAYTDTCVKVSVAAFKIDEARLRKPCECTAAIVVPKLTPGELKAYQVSMDRSMMVKGEPVAVSKLAADNGFTVEEYSSWHEKWKVLNPEVTKTCWQRY